MASHVVPHRITRLARRHSPSQSRRGVVLSLWYGRSTTEGGNNKGMNNLRPGPYVANGCNIKKITVGGIGLSQLLSDTLAQGMKINPAELP